MKSENEESPLSEVAIEEEKFVRERLKLELGREPTKEELDAWVREHTESY